MGFSEILILLFIALILFGPEDLPVIARSIGRVVFEIRKLTSEMTKEFNDAVNTPTAALRKAFEESVNARPDHTYTDASSINDVPADASKPNPPVSLEKLQSDQQTQLLTYEDEPMTPSQSVARDKEKGDPLAGFPKEMLSYEKKETSR